jgi:hypothetical protein
VQETGKQNRVQEFEKDKIMEIRILTPAENKFFLKEMLQEDNLDCLRCPHRYDEILCYECEDFKNRRKQ